MLNWVTPQICFEQQSCKMAKTREVIIILMLFCCTIICTVLSRFIAQFATLFIVVIFHKQSIYQPILRLIHQYCAVHICTVFLYLYGIFTTCINSTGEMQLQSTPLIVPHPVKSDRLVNYKRLVLIPWY